MKIICVLVVLMLLKLGLSQVVNNTKDEVKEILEFLREGDKKIKSTEHKDIIYVLGPTGTGKSTLVHLLAGNPSFLRSVASDEDSEDFIIEHIFEDKIGNVTFQSQTIYPDLIIDESNVPYYDCPGFSDTRNASIEIATTYFTKKVINYAQRLKIVFVVNYNSMLKGFSSRKDFAEFVQHATEIMRKVKLYKNGITLVASKAPTYSEEGSGGDVKLINRVKSFLKEYRKFLAEEADRKNFTDAKSSSDFQSKLDLIDIFLSDERIILFKRPSIAHNLSRIPEVLKNREELRNSINRKINYVEINGADFGYTISDRSKLKINALAEEINLKVTSLFGKINRIVIDHYSNKNKNSNDIVNLKDEFDIAVKTLSKISSNIKTSAMPEYLMGVSQLNIPHLQRNLVDIGNHLNYIEFLETVYDKPITRRTTDWVEALQNCMEYLVKEKNWFSFADKLFHRLSEFDVQSNLSKYDVEDIERWGLGDNKTGNGIFISNENFANFLKNFMALELVKDTEASTSKIDLLNNILNATVKSRPTYTCHSDKMTVKGNFVKLSDLENYEKVCAGTVQLIEVFAMSTIFFDLDFKKNVDLVVIAPKWHIVHTHVRITLDGANGSDGEDRFDSSSFNFLNGSPGMPGKNANNFFGYGDEIVNIKNLYITAVGGNGGHGGNGSKGTDGQETPTKKINEETFGKNVKLISRFDDSDIGFLYFKRKYWVHETFQSYAHCPSINGIGGSGGLGGFGGTIELNGMSEIHTLIKDGEDGLHGSSGKCGKLHDKVELVKSKVTKCSFWFFCGDKITWNKHKFNDTTCLQNCRDSTLVNANGILKPEIVKRPNSALSIDQYKSFVRENLHAMPMRMDSKLVTNFLRSMEQNLKIRAAYDTASFIDDFYQIENQFHRMKNEDNFVYFYQSLLERILEYVSNRSNNLQVNERTILANLYTAGLSKICKIRSGTEQSLIIDIKSYLDVAIDHIRLIEKSGKRVALNEFRNQYRQNLESNINDNHDIITVDIMPEIEKLNLQIDAEFENLLEKVLEEKNSAAFSIDQYNKTKKKLENSIVPQGVLKFLKTVGAITSIFNGFGTVVGRTINTMNQIANAFANDEKNRMPSDKISFTATDELKDNYYQFDNSARSSKNQRIQSIFTIIDEIMKMAIGSSFYDILGPIKEVKKKLIGGKTVDLSSEEIDLLENNVHNIIRKKTAKVKAYSQNETNSLEALDKIDKKLSVLRMDVELFNKFSSNEQKLYEIESAMRQSQAKLLELNNLERNLQVFINPMVNHMRTLLNKFPKKLNNHKIPSLVAIKWHIQNLLKDVRHQMQQFGDGNLNFNGELLHIFDKLDGAISTLSNIFDRIQIYEDQVKLSNYIANIESADHAFGMNSSSQDSDDLSRLHAIIQSNVLLTIFDNALNGFKQSVFPFADFYLRRFNLPPQLETETNLKTLVKMATDELINLKLTLKEYHTAAINQNDDIINTADFSSEFMSSQPFYIWTGSEHKDLIAKLLSGNNVTIKADITKGLKFNAVKFQYLEIHLKSSNPANQSKLDKLLEQFDVVIIHHGNSYYRCDDKYYLITSPIQRIVYSFEKDSSNGWPIRSNNVYHKMRNGDFVLSPYALLTISLTARHTGPFRNFNSSNFYLDHQTLDLELIGRGQYLNPNIKACSGLEKHYVADEVVKYFHGKDELISN